MAESVVLFRLKFLPWSQGRIGSVRMEDKCKLIDLKVLQKTLKVTIQKIGETAVSLNGDRFSPFRPWRSHRSSKACERLERTTSVDRVR